MELALAHYLDMRRTDGSVLRFQNFFINQTADGYSFLPFGFSGVSTSRQAENVTATLGFPNRELARNYANEAANGNWVCRVRTMAVADSSDSNSNLVQLFDYVGRISGANWDQSLVNLSLSTVLDAVKANVPQRALHQRLVGNLPFTSNVAL